MSKPKIYLSGAMTGVSFEEQNEWRQKFVDWFENVAECFNPVAHFSEHYCDNNLADFTGYKSDREVMNFELNELRKSDLVIANLTKPNSLGTMAEIAIAYELRIPVYGITDKPSKLHPWQRDMCERIFKSYESCAMYLLDHYL